MASTHQSILLPCEECGTPVAHPVTDEDDAHHVIMRWLESKATETCAACRALPTSA